MAGQDNYNHPSYLTRQAIRLTAIAGANGTSGHTQFVSDMRVRSWCATTVVAGTNTTANSNLAILQAVGANVVTYTSTGATTNTATATFNLGTAAFSIAAQQTVGAVGTNVADANIRLPAGSVVSVKNGADATGYTSVTLEAYLDPLATWTIGNGN
jgi:hypothetical protein